MPSNELELSGEQFREMVDQALDRLVPFIDSLPDQPASDTSGGAKLAHSLIEPLPQAGSSLAELLDLLFEKLIPKGFNTPGPGYLAYIPGGGLLESSLAELISTAINRYVGVWAASPGLAQLESNVLRWFIDIVGYPEKARGYLSSGGSMANFSAVVTARRRLLGDDLQDAALYCSDQCHHSVTKAAILAGFAPATVRVVQTDPEFRLVPAALHALIVQDRTRGKRPFMVVGSAGTTNTGAVDPLDELADIAKEEGLWFHVDGAYGAAFNMTARGARTLTGLSRSDSVSLDPHKAFFVPYGTGCLLVRDGQALREAHSLTSAYMPQLQEDPLLVDFCEVSPELSRSFRGLQVWLPMKLHGIGAFRRLLDEKLDLTDWTLSQLEKLPDLEIMAQPSLTVIAFRFQRSDIDLETLNRLNQELLAKIVERGRVYLTPTWLYGKFVIRICILSYRTHQDRLEMLLEDLEQALAAIRGRTSEELY